MASAHRMMNAFRSLERILVPHIVTSPRLTEQWICVSRDVFILTNNHNASVDKIMGLKHDPENTMDVLKTFSIVQKVDSYENLAGCMVDVAELLSHDLQSGKRSADEIVPELQDKLDMFMNVSDSFEATESLVSKYLEKRQA